ncbi:MAG: response regulator [Parvularculaceae bacterium]
MALKDILKVMVVDDMTVSRGLLESSLDAIGVKNVDYQKEGQAALKALAAKPAHLIISDYNMPVMDGLALLKALRGNKATEKIGFILVTGSEDATVISKGKGLGMNNYLKKPFTPESLRACIEAVVGPLG